MYIYYLYITLNSHSSEHVPIDTYSQKNTHRHMLTPHANIHTHTHTHTHTLTNTVGSIYSQTRAPKHILTDTYSHLHLHTRTDMLTHTCPPLHTYTYSKTHLFTPHRHMRTITLTHTHRSMPTTTRTTTRTNARTADTRPQCTLMRRSYVVNESLHIYICIYM